MVAGRVELRFFLANGVGVHWHNANKRFSSNLLRNIDNAKENTMHFGAGLDFIVALPYQSRVCMASQNQPVDDDKSLQRYPQKNQPGIASLVPPEKKHVPIETIFVEQSARSCTCHQTAW